MFDKVWTVDIAGVRAQLLCMANSLPVAALAGHVELGKATAAELAHAFDGTDHQSVHRALSDVQTAVELIDQERVRLATAADRLTDTAARL